MNRKTGRKNLLIFYKDEAANTYYDFIKIKQARVPQDTTPCPSFYPEENQLYTDCVNRWLVGVLF